MPNELHDADVTIKKFHVKELMDMMVDKFFDHIGSILGVEKEKELPDEWHTLYDETLLNMEKLINDWVEHQVK